MTPEPAPQATPPVLRAGRDEDAAGFIALISRCWAEYPGCVMDLDGENPQLRAYASHIAALGGALWVAEAVGGAVVGMVAVVPGENGIWELRRMYVDAAQRGHGIAHLLADAAERHARAQGASHLMLWTDTRFDRSHRFYEKRSFVRAGAIRALDDLSHSLEFCYAKPIAGIVVQRLDAAAAASAERRLGGVLKACVDGGAAISFLPPLSDEAACSYWHGVSSGVGRGMRILLVAWAEGAMVGTVQFDLAMPPNQPHRAELQKLMVLPEWRRHGIAAALMRAAEHEATIAGRALLTLDTRAGDSGEQLYRSLGWTEAGCIPDYAMNPDGTFHDTLLFWKRIGTPTR